MSINSDNQYGKINLSNEAIAAVAGKAAAESYGVVGLAARPSLYSYVSRLLKINEYEKGIYVRKTLKGYAISVYVYLAFDVRITEAISELQKKVKWQTERAFGIKLASVDVYVEGLKDFEK